MKVVPVAVLALLAATTLAGCGGPSSGTSVEVTTKPPLAPDKGAITGVVIDDRYRPVPGALVLLTPSGLTATADAEGQFGFTDLAPGAYVALGQADAHEAAPKNVDVKAGEYTEVELMARRIFNDNGAIVTNEYSVFVPCAASVPAGTEEFDCTGDLSGDSFRAGFTSDYTAYGKKATYLVTEMKANHKASTSGAFKVVVRDSSGSDPYFASKFTADGDYLKLVMKLGNVSLDDTEMRNVKWDNKKAIETAFFAQGQFKAETQSALDAACAQDPSQVTCFESRGLGPQVGVKAKFVQSLFIGEPTVDIATYSTMGEQ